MNATHTIRLQKVIADAGITSRRKAEELILQGRVKVNGLKVNILGTKVNPRQDVVMVDGESIDAGKKEKIYLLFHKPRGVMTTLSDPEGRKTVMDFVQDITERIYPVGRLDYLSEGLLLMTNDGDVANTIIHPRGCITKVYEVKVFGAITPGILKELRKGYQSEVGFLKPKSVRVIKQLKAKTWLEFRLGDGKNREIRRLCEACGLTIDKLKRVAIGGLTVEGIAPGSWRMLSLKQLLHLIGIDKGGRVKVDYEYESPKRSVNLRMKGVQNCTSANDQAFTKFRKETYFSSLREIEAKKLREAKEKNEAQARLKEEKHQKRVFKKKKRLEKRDEKKNSVHAQILKW